MTENKFILLETLFNRIELKLKSDYGAMAIIKALDDKDNNIKFVDYDGNARETRIFPDSMLFDLITNQDNQTQKELFNILGFEKPDTDNDIDIADFISNFDSKKPVENYCGLKSVFQKKKLVSQFKNKLEVSLLNNSEDNKNTNKLKI